MSIYVRVKNGWLHPDGVITKKFPFIPFGETSEYVDRVSQIGTRIEVETREPKDFFPMLFDHITPHQMVNASVIFPTHTPVPTKPKTD